MFHCLLHHTNEQHANNPQNKTIMPKHAKNADDHGPKMKISQYGMVDSKIKFTFLISILQGSIQIKEAYTNLDVFWQFISLVMTTQIVYFRL